MRLITADQVDRALSWAVLVEALDQGHKLGRGMTEDLLLRHGADVMLNRAAWKPGYGVGLKSVTGFFGNPERTPPLPSVQGLFVLFDHADGRPLAVIDGAALTAWKTAADSALGSRYLSRPDARRLLMIGAGAMAGPLIRAHLAVRPGIEEVTIWNRTAARVGALARSLEGVGVTVRIAHDLAGAVPAAEIVCAATMTETPLIRGEWLEAGTHVDLVGAFTPTMREADDEALSRARLFVDARETTIEHIGELIIPLHRGVIGEADIEADLYDLAAGFAWRRAPDDITLYKNGGGAHLDLMTATTIYRSLEDEH